MHTRAVHTRLALLAFAIVVAASAVGFLAYRQAEAKADTMARQAGLVAVSLDDQALVVALQDERWQKVRDGDLDAAREATDALIEVRDFDLETVDQIAAARSTARPGGYAAAIARLLERSGHADPALLVDLEAARAAVNVDLIHWRQALIAELESVLGREGQEALGQARAETSEWSTTLRLSATRGQADAVEAATGASTLDEHREKMDGATRDERVATATSVWNEAHEETARIVAEGDAAIWANLVAERDAARRQTRLVPLLITAAALVALLGLLWVGRRWPIERVTDPDEVSLDALVSVEPEAEPTDPSETDVFADAPGSGDPAPDAEAEEQETAADDEKLFRDTVVSRVPSPRPKDGDLFTDASPDAPVPSTPETTGGGPDTVGLVVDAAIGSSLRPGDVVIESLSDSRVVEAVAGDLVAMVTTLLDSAMAHGRPDSPITVVGTAHELGYLIWIVDEVAAIDPDRRRQLNEALGGRIGAKERSELLRRLAAVGERAGEAGIDIELLGDDDTENLARIFVPARHLIDEQQTDGPAEEPAAPPAAEPMPGADADEPTSDFPDPLALVTTERLSARLARLATEPAVPPAPPMPARPVPQPGPAAAETPDPARPAIRRPVAELGPLVLGSSGDPAGGSDADRRAAAARRVVEQYRGGVGAAMMDAADDIIRPERIEDRP